MVLFWYEIRAQVLVSIDCVFDASLVPGTCLGRFLDLKGLINKFLESRLTGQVRHGTSFSPRIDATREWPPPARFKENKEIEITESTKDSG